MRFADRLTAAWYAPRLTPLTAALVPAAMLFHFASGVRRLLYRRKILRSVRLPVPVIVVGNITVGGSGKTPLVIALARALVARGWRPGIVSRGYGGSAKGGTAVSTDDDPQRVGDEPLLLARTGYPVWVGRDRPAAASALLEANDECNVVIADDGLQHYALERDVEIAVVDATRPFGNGWPLPTGPLREPKSRLRCVDASVVLSADSAPPAPGFVMCLEGARFVHLNVPTQTAGPEGFRRRNVHAIAGIGHPERFFAHLAALGIAATCHAFPDHHHFSASDIACPGASAILMTEKDAVKCARFADDRCWMLPVRAVIDAALIDLVEEKLRGCQAARDSRVSGHQGSVDL